MRRCPTCGAALSRSTKRHRQRVGVQEFLVTVAAARCHGCDGVFLENDALVRADLEVACELARHGPISGDAFRFLRKALGFRALVIAELLGVTPETVSRWENRQRPVDQAAWLALGSLVLEHANRRPETFERLRDLRSGAAVARSVRIDATRAPRSPLRLLAAPLRPARRARTPTR